MTGRAQPQVWCLRAPVRTFEICGPRPRSRCESFASRVPGREASRVGHLPLRTRVGKAPPTHCECKNVTHPRLIHTRACTRATKISAHYDLHLRIYDIRDTLYRAITPQKGNRPAREKKAKSAISLACAAAAATDSRTDIFLFGTLHLPRRQAPLGALERAPDNRSCESSRASTLEPRSSRAATASQELKTVGLYQARPRLVQNARTWASAPRCSRSSSITCGPGLSWVG